jgi:hypothetical protein
MGLSLDRGTVIRGNGYVLALSALVFSSNGHRRADLHIVDACKNFAWWHGRGPETVESRERHYASSIIKELTDSRFAQRREYCRRQRRQTLGVRHE